LRDGGDGDWILGIDVGGTNLVVGAVPSAGGEPAALRRGPTGPPGEPEETVARIRSLVQACAEELDAGEGSAARRIVGAGVGAPGPIDRSEGVVVETPNLRWNDFPLRRRLADTLGIEVELDNDANCAVFGEWWQGAGRGARSVVGLTLGTGVGGGIVLDGELVHGASDAAGEVGHMIVEQDGRRCGCGNEGCLEAYVSGPNIAARAVEGIRAGARSELVERVGGDLSRLTGETVYEGVVAEDAFARCIMDETARLLGLGVANLVNVLNPERVVVAGGVTRAGSHLFEPLRREVERRAFPTAVRACRILPAELGDRAGVVGAAGVFQWARTGAL